MKAPEGSGGDVTQLNDRMMRAATFGDGRLLRISREARLLASVVEALADPTGCLKLDPDEIRTPVALYLADSAGLPPSREQVVEWIDELVAAQWIVVYREVPRLGYLHGFGTRQTGANVCLGVDTAGIVKPHLPLPSCVTLDQAKNSEGKPLPKLLPVHCTEPWESCPCEEVAMPSGPPPETSKPATRRRKGTKGKGGDLELKEPESKETQARGGDAGEGTGALPAYLLDLLHEHGIPIPSGKPAEELALALSGLNRADGVRSMRRAIAEAGKHEPTPRAVDAEWLTFYAETANPRHEGTQL